MNIKEVLIWSSVWIFLIILIGLLASSQQTINDIYRSNTFEDCLNIDNYLSLVEVDPICVDEYIDRMNEAKLRNDLMIYINETGD